MPRQKIFDKLIPIQLKLEPAQYNILINSARRNKVSMSAIIRRLITNNLENNAKEGDK